MAHKYENKLHGSLTVGSYTGCDGVLQYAHPNFSNHCLELQMKYSSRLISYF